MTQGFYEQLGVDPGATTSEIRAAYTRLVAQLQKRRKAIVEHGGDPSPLDLSRSQADEAWKVLGDPPRRRKYDAMLAVQDDLPKDGTELWRRSSGALVHPAAGAAAELLRVASNLKIGAMPPVPRPPGATRRRSPPEEEVTVTATSPTAAPLTVQDDLTDDDLVDISEGARIVPLPTRAETTPEPGLRIVDGSRSASTVVVLPPRRKLLSSEDLARFVERFGYTGALLKAVREAKDLTLQEMSDTTRISVRYLEAIESDQHDRLPSSTFVRGYVREMARLLALDEEETVSGYMRRLR